MQPTSITCPKCSHSFSIDEAISEEYKAKISKDFDEKIAQKDAEISILKDDYKEKEKQNKVLKRDKEKH